MTSVHKINKALAEVQGSPLATIEAYSRVLRREGVLPKTKRGGGRAPLTTTMAGYMLAAVMRGSPINAAENAREVGDLILHSVDDSTFEPMLQRPREALAWPDDMSFVLAIGWLIDRYVDGTINNFVAKDTGVKVEVDRYWTQASLHWYPTGQLLDQYVEGWREALKIEPRRKNNGELDEPMKIGFHTPLLHVAKISYRVDAKRNREAHRKFQQKKKEAQQHDKWGTEFVTHRTLIALSEVFKRDEPANEIPPRED